MTGHPRTDSSPELRPLAALLAWLLPGLGHWMLGQRVRALRIMAGMWLLILGGILLLAVARSRFFSTNSSEESR